MPPHDLLPGVTTAACPPAVVCDARAAIRAARRRAWLRDGAQIVLLIAVDILFVDWADARLPFADRATSLSILRWINVLIIGHIWMTHAFPAWSARRIASTWCRRERDRFGS